jgi:hypothetical protein
MANGTLRGFAMLLSAVLAAALIASSAQASSSAELSGRAVDRRTPDLPPLL